MGAGNGGKAADGAASAPTGEAAPHTSAASAQAPLTIGGDWPVQATRKVEDLVSIIRDKTVRPVSQTVRYLLFGLLAIFVSVVMAVLFAIFAIRVLDTEVPVFRTRVWASYLVVAGIFWLGGLLLSRKRHSRS